jgi:hypothetical protein
MEQQSRRVRSVIVEYWVNWAGGMSCMLFRLVM